MVPLMSRNARTTQNQAKISRRIFCSRVRLDSGVFVGLAFTFHRNRRDFRGFTVAIFLRPGVADFELDEVGRVDARITGRAEASLGVSDRLLESIQGNVAEGIGAQEFADLGGAVGGSNELFARGSIHPVI